MYTEKPDRTSARYRTQVVVWGVFLALWQVAAASLSSSYIPTPVEVGGAVLAIVTSGGFLDTLAITGARVFLGILLVMFLGNLMLLAAHRTRTGRLIKDELLFPLTYTMPTIVWILVVAVVAGLSFISPVLVIAIAATPFYIINMEEALKDIDRKLLEVGQVFGTDRYARFVHVTLPLLYPHLISAFRLVFGLSWRMIVLIEIFTATRGIGTQIQLAQQMYNVDVIIAWGFIIIVIVSVADRMLMLLDRRVLRRHLEDS